MKTGKSFKNKLALRRFNALLLTVIVGFGGYTLTHLSSAASYSHSPIGYVNGCGLVFNQTFIYGWAYDADSGNNNFPKVNVNVGGYSGDYYTDQGGYYEAKVRDYINSHLPGAPITGTYGFAAGVSTALTKGTVYSVAAAAYNVDAGANAFLGINTSSSNNDGIGSGGHYALNPNGTLPDACLALPAPVTPPPSDPKITVCDLKTKQIVTITMSQYKSDTGRYTTDLSKCSTTPVTPPPPTGGGGGTGTGTGTGTHAIPSSNPVIAAAQSDDENKGKANATVAAGTLSASIEIPGDGAKEMYVLYGTSADGLDNSSDNIAASGDKASVILADLQPKATYYYQIVRSDAAGTITTSPPTTFKTAGYAIALHFIDGDKKVLKGIDGVLNDADQTQAKSDQNGDMKYYDLDVGTYDVKFSYNKLTYTRSFNTDSVSTEDSSSGKVVVLKDTVNVSTLKNGSTKPLPTKGHSVVKIILLLLSILLIGGVIGWLFWRRRQQAALYDPYASPYGGAGPGVIDTPTPEGQQVMPPPTSIAPSSTSTPPSDLTTPVNAAPTAPPTGPNGEPLEHVGESLREMVIRSMHDEAQKRKHNP